MKNTAVNEFFRKKNNKRKVGRPKLKRTDRRSAKMNVSLLADEAKRLDAIASREGKTFSTWAREILLDAVNGRRRS
jgi:hypothetical protein